MRRDKRRRKLQSKVNKIFRQFNAELSSDKQFNWCHVQQRSAAYCPYEDGSGGYLRIGYEVRDSRTGISSRYVEDISNSSISANLFAWNVFKNINNFIYVIETGV